MYVCNINFETPTSNWMLLTIIITLTTLIALFINTTYETF